jgi:hypothetical protein
MRSLPKPLLCGNALMGYGSAAGWSLLYLICHCHRIIFTPNCVAGIAQPQAAIRLGLRAAYLESHGFALFTIRCGNLQCLRSNLHRNV